MFSRSRVRAVEGGMDSKKGRARCLVVLVNVDSSNATHYGSCQKCQDSAHFLYDLIRAK